MFPARSFENRNVYSGWPENPRRPILLYLGVLPQRLRGGRRRHRCRRADGRISRSVGARGFASHRAGPRCIRRLHAGHRRGGPRWLLGGRRLRAAVRVLGVVAAPGHIGDSLSHSGGRSHGRRRRDGHGRRAAFSVVVSVVRRGVLRGRRRLAGAVRDDDGHVHLRRARRHVVVHAVREQRVVPPMVMRLPAPLRLVLLGLRSVCFLRLLPARLFLRLARGGGRRGGCLSRTAGPGRGSLDWSRAVFVELLLRRRHSLVNCACDGLRCSELRGRARDALRVRVSGLVVFLMVATRVTLRGMVVRSVRAARFLRVGELLLVVRDELRPLLHQVSANLLRCNNGN